MQVGGSDIITGALRLLPVAALAVTNSSSERRAFKVVVQSGSVHHYDIYPSSGVLDGNEACVVNITVRLSSDFHPTHATAGCRDLISILSASVPKLSPPSFQIEDLFCESSSHELAVEQLPICIEATGPIRVPISSVRPAPWYTCSQIQ
jgi:hypothetical protein